MSQNEKKPNNKNEDEVPIRIVKKKVHHGGHHGGSWKVAYADFVTAMLAMFIVLWIIGAGDDVKQGVAEYFRDPSGYLETMRQGGILENEMGPFPSEHHLEALLIEAQERRLLMMGERILQSLQESQGAGVFLEQVTYEIVDEGLRIELLESSETFFFDVGTAVLNPDAMEVLQIIAAEILNLPNKVIIEGHTDSRQYPTTKGYTNFELSVDRANSARRVLVANGLTHERILEIRGYADRKLKNEEDPYDASNRRISIIITFAELADEQ